MHSVGDAVASIMDINAQETITMPNQVHLHNAY